MTPLSHTADSDQTNPFMPSAATPRVTALVQDRWWVSRLAWFAAVAVFGLAGDLLSKQLIFAWRGFPGESPVWWIAEGYVGIQTAINPGALFGFGAGWGKVFALFSIAAAIGIVVWLFVFGAARSWWINIASACILGGILGNMYDRMGIWYSPDMPQAWSSGVRDWILFCYKDYTWPNFNIADSLLVCGTAVLAWRSLFYNDPNLAQTTRADNEEPAPAK